MRHHCSCLCMTNKIILKWLSDLHDAVEDFDAKFEETREKMEIKHHHTSMLYGTGGSDDEGNKDDVIVVANQAAI